MRCARRDTVARKSISTTGEQMSFANERLGVVNVRDTRLLLPRIISAWLEFTAASGCQKSFQGAMVSGRSGNAGESMSLFGRPTAMFLNTSGVLIVGIWSERPRVGRFSKQCLACDFPHYSPHGLSIQQRASDSNWTGFATGFLLLAVVLRHWLSSTMECSTIAAKPCFPPNRLMGFALGIKISLSSVSKMEFA
jgi:hypothetical protein